MDTSRRRRGQSTLGVTFVETLILVGLVGLAAVGAFLAFGTAIQKKTQEEAQHVAKLDSLGPSTGSSPQCTGTACANGTSCFVAGTPVGTPNGPRPIESLAVGDDVLSFDEVTGVERVERVVHVYVTKNMPVASVLLREGRETLRATPGHRFYSKERGWIPVWQLHPGEPLVPESGGGGADSRVDSVAPLRDRETVYNLEVEHTHTYFVGERGVLVHNGIEPVPGNPGSFRPTKLPPNGAVLNLSNDPESKQESQALAAAYGVPYVDLSTVNVNDPANAKLLSQYGSTIINSHGGPSEIQWGNEDIPAYQAVGNLQKLGYDPGKVDPNADMTGVMCHACEHKVTPPTMSPSFGAIANATLEVPFWGIDKGENDLNLQVIKPMIMSQNGQTITDPRRVGAAQSAGRPVIIPEPPNQYIGHMPGSALPPPARPNLTYGVGVTMKPGSSGGQYTCLQ